MSGGGNSTLGARTLKYNTIGSHNTAFGVDTLRYNTTGSRNTALGADGVLYNNTTGSDNTAVGTVALGNNTTGGGNIALGSYAGVYLTSGDNNIYLSNPGQATESGIIRIGEPGVHTQTFLAGNVVANGGIAVAGSPVIDVSGHGVGSPTGLVGPARAGRTCGRHRRTGASGATRVSGGDRAARAAG
jgi:hypothetical protein